MKTIKMHVTNDVHKRLVAKAKSLGIRREVFYAQIMEKASKQK